MNSFSDFDLLPSLLKTLKSNKMARPTEIQVSAIPLLLAGKSVVGIAETGSGKTLAFALPILHYLKKLEDDGDVVKNGRSPRAVIVTPTRELGEQISKVFKMFTHETRLRVRPALGGMAMEQAKRNIAGPFEILLATPGRLMQMMELDLIDLSEVHILIFDEADQMLDEGFMPNSGRVVQACPGGVQMGLFSATVSAKVQQMMENLFADAEVLRTASAGKTVSTLKTLNKVVTDGKRMPVLESVLAKPVDGGTLVFTNTREQCDKLAKELKEKGFNCAVYRGEMDKNTRRANLKKFRDGHLDMLISTDIAGRGLDIENVGRVINYHLPKQMDNYLHRVGRTARAGRSGLVINLVTERDENLVSRLKDV